MSPLPTVLSTERAPAARARPTVGAAANANASNMLERQPGGEEPFVPRRSQGRRETDASRFGTDGDEPLWNGPRLRPTFVAQVLGQVMNDTSTPRGAYPKIAGIAPGAFFDSGV